MVNGQLALKLVGMVRNLAKDKLPRLHQMGDKIVKEILRRQWLAMMSPVQVGDYIFGKKRKPLHYKPKICIYLISIIKFRYKSKMKF